jgi:hypothetical protein
MNRGDCPKTEEGDPQIHDFCRGSHVAGDENSDKEGHYEIKIAIIGS